MKYHLFCDITQNNLLRLFGWGYSPDISRYPGKYYIDSYLEPEYLQISIGVLGGVTGLAVKKEKVSAKEMDYLYTLRNIQYRLSRFTDRFRKIICF